MTTSKQTQDAIKTAQDALTQAQANIERGHDPLDHIEQAQVMLTGLLVSIAQDHIKQGGDVVFMVASGQDAQSVASDKQDLLDLLDVVLKGKSSALVLKNAQDLAQDLDAQDALDHITQAFAWIQDHPPKGKTRQAIEHAKTALVSGNQAQDHQGALDA